MTQHQRLLSTALLVATLGYFVDVYDLVLFIVLKNPSLKELGVPKEQFIDTGAALLNTQMIGMLVGGVVWGLLGDKIGRTRVLFGSIAIYSLANILNGFIESLPSYYVLRALAGFGLAGELGAGVTLVAELLPQRLRGYGTTIIAAVGVTGAIVAGLTGELLPWRLSYIVGGVLGLLLLVVRFSVAESGLFDAIRERNVLRGSLGMLLSSPKRVSRYLLCIILGLPTWYVIGILMVNAVEISHALGVEGAPKPGWCLIWCYLGVALGDIGAGLLSQYLQSRKRPMAIFLILGLVTPCWFLTHKGVTVDMVYLNYLFMGFSVGYWILIVTAAAEQFGTNLRATVATSVPNFIRASVVPMSWLFLTLRSSLDIVSAAMYVGIITSALAAVSLIFIKETFSNDLDFIES